MDIVKFFEKVEGKWFSQRTLHYLADEKSVAGQSNLLVELVSNADADVAQLCQKHDADPALALCGLRIKSEATVQGDPRTHVQTTLLVPLGQADALSGTLLRYDSLGPTAPVKGTYQLDADEVLTLTTEADGLSTEERLWFVNPNLRMRTSMLKRPDGFAIAAFCSEIRMGLTRPAEG